MKVKILKEKVLEKRQKKIWKLIQTEIFYTI